MQTGKTRRTRLLHRLSSSVDSQLSTPDSDQRRREGNEGTASWMRRSAGLDSARAFKQTRTMCMSLFLRRHANPPLRLPIGSKATVPAPSESASPSQAGVWERSPLDAKLLCGDGRQRLGRNHPTLYHGVPREITSGRALSFLSHKQDGSSRARSISKSARRLTKALITATIQG